VDGLTASAPLARLTILMFGLSLKTQTEQTISATAAMCVL
jgi:hypothetical protein